MRRLHLLILSGCVAWGCDGADPAPGLELGLRVPAGQLVRGEIPAPAGGPEVTFLEVPDPQVTPGEAGQPLRGRVPEGAFAVRVGLAGEDAHWVVPVGTPDPTVPGDLEWSAHLDFAASLPTGPVEVEVQAVDARERGGPVSTARFELRDATPAGALVVALRWDTQADVDLYVTTPAGVTIGPKNINSFAPPAPGEPPAPPDAWRQGGVLDIDSNADCVVDGRRREHVVWEQAPPAGRYRVAVDLASPCGWPRAGFRVEVLRDDEVLARGAGVLYPSDARETAAGGAAPLTVLEFDVP